MDWNEFLNVATPTALAGRLLIARRTAWITYSFKEGGTVTPCFLTAVHVQNYTAEVIVVK